MDDVLGPFCCCWVAKLCPSLCDPMDCSLPHFSVHGTSQARILEWFAISFCVLLSINFWMVYTEFRKTIKWHHLVVTTQSVWISLVISNVTSSLMLYIEIANWYMFPENQKENVNNSSWSKSVIYRIIYHQKRKFVHSTHWTILDSHCIKSISYCYFFCSFF